MRRGFVEVDFAFAISLFSVFLLMTIAFISNSFGTCKDEFDFEALQAECFAGAEFLTGSAGWPPNWEVNPHNMSELGFAYYGAKNNPYLIQQEKIDAIRLLSYDEILNLTGVEGIQIIIENKELNISETIGQGSMRKESCSIDKNVIIEKVNPDKDIDVVLLIDRSGSMKADDFMPNRLKVAKLSGQDFINQLEDIDRVGVVYYAAVPYMLMNITYNHNAVNAAINNITFCSTWGWNCDGTAIGDAITKGRKILKITPTNRKKVIVLLSDGKNNRGSNPITAANRAKAENITIYSIGISLSGDGAATLQQVASITGGLYFSAPTQQALQDIMRNLGRLITQGVYKGKIKVVIWQ